MREIMNDEVTILKKRFLELAKRSYQNNMYVFTDFLTISEQAAFFEIEKELSYAGWKLWGGLESCERRMLRFGSEENFGYEEAFPISCIQIRPLIKKFADDLNHRDFLGALMHLGIERNVLGDILIRDKEAFLLCEDSMAQYIAEHLDKVRHTSVSCTLSEEIPRGIEPELESQELITSSNRADSIVSKVYQLSRSQSLTLFREKKVFVDGRQYENNSGILKEGNLVSVRGYGRFIYRGVIQETKKGRIRIEIERYV